MIYERSQLLASEKAVPAVTNCTELGDPKRSRDLLVPIARGKIGVREVDVMSDTEKEGVVVRKGVVEESQLTDESCLLISFDNTALK
ncbi:hypothetical protein PoB_000921400 [Plakobranchus ocellatus]|uniref:Uncharacterized protein n=1 Tax=Plakobranchus ocellatus TaxID=259542 RepID=A0AAV3YI74_9GAST|nr:hypothetical protein PoB_000921400 [Plakobranchus ocellatus]